MYSAEMVTGNSKPEPCMFEKTKKNKKTFVFFTAYAVRKQ